MPIERAKMRVRVYVPSHSAKHMKDKLVQIINSVEQENWQEGSLELVRKKTNYAIIAGLKCLRLFIF